MDFFDTAVNKTKEAFDIAYKKTNEVVTTQKQKFDISSLEGKRFNDFEALGEIYFSQVKDSEENEAQVAELVASIKEKSEKIDELRAEILKAKNRRICPACGASIEKASVFCNACGAKVILTSEEDA